jgi:hypothetical protein
MRRSVRMSLTCFAAALAPAALLLVRPAAHAEPAPAPLTVELEIAEAGRAGEPPLAATLTMALERGCSSVQARRDAVRYDVVVCREGGDARTPVLGFTIERSVSSAKVHSVAKLRVTARLALGRRVVVGRVVHPGGGGTEVRATAR